MLQTYFEKPQNDHTNQNPLLRKSLEVDPDCTESKRCGYNVSVEEEFVECMANRRRRLDQNEYECGRAL